MRSLDSVGVRPHRKAAPASRANKPVPSKWDDAQKWLVKHRSSNADDRRLLSSQNARSSVDGALEEYSMAVTQSLGEGDDDDVKKIDCGVVRPLHHGVCLRDMGTEMTPIASKEPSRTATPLRASTPVDVRSPVSSRSSTPVRRRGAERSVTAAVAVEGTANNVSAAVIPACRDANSLESRAAAWDEAERAKFTARYKREEVKIQAWENHETRKAETEMKRVQMKADQMKARAQEKLANRLSATRRVAEEKRASAEAKLNEHAARTSEKANYIRRTGHLPSSFFNFKMTCLCG